MGRVTISIGTAMLAGFTPEKPGATSHLRRWY